MLKKTALKIVGGLSNTSKMPSKSYGLPASECNTGSILRKIPNSVCSGCYARKGCYSWNVVQKAQFNRLECLNDTLWVDAMVVLLKDMPLFRWHDSGDLQSYKHLLMIMEVVELTPSTKHWLPTKEVKLIKQYLKTGIKIPHNLTVRLSTTMIDYKPPRVNKGINTSTVHHLKPVNGVECTAPSQNGECRECRICWERSIENVSYKKH